MSSKKVLVTGADGFIGSHLTEALVRSGYETRAFVMYNSLNSWGWLDRRRRGRERHFEVVAGDIRDPHGVASCRWRGAMRCYTCGADCHSLQLHSPDSYVRPT